MDKKAIALLLGLIGGVSSDTYTKEEIDSMISQLKQFETKKVEELPLTGQIPNCIYFVPKDTSGLDGCYEYMWIDNKWEFVGSTDVDLSDYWTIDQTIQYLENYVAEHQYVLPEATTEKLGGIKLASDGAVTLDSNGNIIIATTSNEDIEKLFETISA